MTAAYETCAPKDGSGRTVRTPIHDQAVTRCAWHDLGMRSAAQRPRRRAPPPRTPTPCCRARTRTRPRRRVRRPVRRFSRAAAWRRCCGGNRSANGRRGGRVVYANAQLRAETDSTVLYNLHAVDLQRLEHVLGRTDLSGRLEDLQFFVSLFGFLFFIKNI